MTSLMHANRMGKFNNESAFGVYIHIPFCRRKCFYCDFNSYIIDAAITQPYIEALTKEIEFYAEKFNHDKEVSSIYFGGGTPSILYEEALGQVLCAVFNYFKVKADAEISIEANPETISYTKLSILKKLGFNRLSLGIQSFDDRLLKLIGREHSSKDNLSCYYNARAAGFTNINFDLLFGLPSQSYKTWITTLETTIKLQPEHISAYCLTIEPGTKFYSLYSAGKLAAAAALPGEAMQLKMYKKAIEIIEGAGYEHYEISNFAKPQRRCIHNLLYWSYQPYIGFGAGAHSFIDNSRYWNIKAPQLYIQRVLNAAGSTREAVEGKEVLSDRQRMGEFIMVGLRLLKDGVNLEEFELRFGLKLSEVYKAVIENLKSLGLIYQYNGAIRLTRKGLPIANRVILEFLP